MTLLGHHWRERVLGVLCVTLLFLVASLAVAPPSDAQICKRFGYKANCRIVFGGDKSDGGGDDGGGGGGGGVTRPLCHLGAPDYRGVPCDSDSAGPWSNQHQCYILPSETPPDPSDPEYREDGEWYSCMGVAEDGTTPVPKEDFWAAEPPRSPIGGNLKEDLETAIGIDFLAMYPGIAPEPIPNGGRWDDYRMGAVGNWVWMWPREPLGGMYEPPKAEDPSTGYFVEASVKKLEWDMGDGTIVTCTGPPVPYMPYMEDRRPECGHTYEKPGTYMVRVKTTWTVKYRDANGYDEIDFELPHRSVFVRIGENQVVNK